MRICKIARVRDKALDRYVEVIEFPVSTTETSRLELPPSVINDPVAFEKRLRDAGALLPKDRNKLKKRLTTVAQCDAPVEWVYEAHTGWSEDRKAFVRLGSVIGRAQSHVIGINQTNTIVEPSGRLLSNGTWESWRDSVAAAARFSSCMMFSISAAFAAPLLTIKNRQSFTFSIFGGTRIGKSIATLMGASVIGVGRLSDLMTWNTTDARLEQRLAEYNDSIFPIDDLMTMAGNDRERYQRIHGIAYKLAQGWAKARHDSYTRVYGGTRGGWRCIPVTSNEIPIRDLAKRARLERQHGEALRLIDVPALFELPKTVDPGNLPDWKKGVFQKLLKDCFENHGAAFDKYISDLIVHNRDVGGYVDHRIAYFVQQVCDGFDGDVARDVAEKFGLIYAGGMLGRRYGLLPWKKDSLLDAIAKCFHGARDLLPDDGVALRQGVKVLRTTLRELPSITRASKEAFDGHDGYRERLKKVTRYIVKRDVLNAVSESQKRLVIEWLAAKKRITFATPKASGGEPRITPKAQFIWPDGVRRRSVEIFWPLKFNKRSGR
jgi:putative DNA primase/helicase